MKVGDVGIAGGIATSRPAQGDMSGGSELTLYSNDGQGGRNPLDSDPVDVGDLPFDEPFAVGFRYDTVPQHANVAQATLLISNTVAVSVAYTGTVTLPPGWVFVSGEASFSGELEPGESTTRNYHIGSPSVPQEWSTVVDIFIGDHLSPSTYHDYHITQHGGLDEAGNGILGTQIGSFPGTSSSNMGSWTEFPPCSGCPGLGALHHLRVLGDVTLHGPDDDFDGGQLHLRVYRILRPPPGFPVRRALIRMMLTADDGSFEFCLGFGAHGPSGAIQLEVWSLDSPSGNPGTGGGKSVSVQDWVTDELFIEPSQIHPIPEDICALELEFELDADPAAPFFVTTFYAVAVRNFVSGEGPPRSVHTGNYPFKTRYPYPDEPGRGATSRCWGECWISAEHAWRMDVTAHEYGHHAHFAEGGAGNTETFIEGWANLFQGVMDVEDYYLNGVHMHAHASCNFEYWFECYTHPGNNTDNAGGGAYLWDIWDDVNTEPQDLERCRPAVNDTLTTPFNDIYNVMDTALDLGDIFGNAPSIYDSLPQGAPLDAITRNHRMTDDDDAILACDP